MSRIRVLPKYVSEFRDRHGKYRVRFRRKGQDTYYFKARPGTDEFALEYQACLAGVEAPVVQPGAGRAAHGSIDDLIARYYRSPAWNGMSKESSRNTYRGIIERFREKHGAKPVAAVRTQHLDAILGAMKDTPAAANNLRKVLRRLFAYAVKIDMRTDNPALHTDGFRNRSAGFHTWTEEEIAQYQAKHRLGTRARLAMELMLWTGQRGRSDVTRFGPAHIVDGRIRLTQTKTGTAQSIKLSRQLKAAIDAMPPLRGETFLETEYGKPFTPAGFGNKFREWCDEAGLNHCAAHGLRKAMSRRLAELGATHSEGKAVTGHKRDREFDHYAAQANQTLLADRAIDKLGAAKMANPNKKVSPRAPQGFDKR